MLKHRMLTLLVVVAMMAIMTASASANETHKYRPAHRQSTSTICYVAGRFYLTPAEALRRIGSWTDSQSASNECPSSPSRFNAMVGFIPNDTLSLR